MIVNVVHGFLGAGKTTFIRYVMEKPPLAEKVVILVNEFGEIGVDGLILSSEGGQASEIVEMPSGCICCTLAVDFRRQMLELYERLRPDRVIVEPTGVASVAQIKHILEGEDLRHICKDVRLVHLLDASEFMAFIKSHRHYMENQIRQSHVILLNKVDRVKPMMVNLLLESIKEINPNVKVFPTSYGRVDDATLETIWDTPHRVDDDFTFRFDDDLLHHHDHGLADQFQSYGRQFVDSFSKGRLVSFFERLKKGDFGEIIRAKGVFQTSEGWVRLELASKEVQLDEVSACGHNSVVAVIGREINTQDVEACLTECLEKGEL
ncbi:MAG: CobW family GTP-binding protein [Desulfomonilaceae bacterium]